MKAARLWCLGAALVAACGDPVAPPPPEEQASPWSLLSVGGVHNCGLAGGVPYCWGWNEWGQLGVGTTAEFLFMPTAVVTGGAPPFVAVYAGSNHSCGLTSDGAAYCWGGNVSGQLGTDPIHHRPLPVVVSGGISFTALAISSYEHTCGLTASGAAYCWGGNGQGQLGNGSINASATPVAVSGGFDFAALVAGNSHTCGLTGAGAAYCWGDNDGGQLGTGSFVSYVPAPSAVAGGQVFTSLTAGTNHTCGLTAGGTAFCWGGNYHGQLGNGSRTDASSPLSVSGGRAFRSLSAAGSRTCGLADDGSVYCWGEHMTDLVASPATVPELQPGDVAFAFLQAGTGHVCGLTSAGVAYCWGSNSYGQLGDRSTTNRETPTAVVAP